VKRQKCHVHLSNSASASERRSPQTLYRVSAPGAR